MIEFLERNIFDAELANDNFDVVGPCLLVVDDCRCFWASMRSILILEWMANLDLDIDADIDGSYLGETFRFMHLGEVPVMIVGSIALSMLWFCTIVTNHYWNQDASYAISLVYFIPNLVASLLCTRILLLPFVTIFKDKETPPITHENLINALGAVKTTEVNESFGQIEIQIDGPPIVINARTSTGQRLVKGDCAKNCRV